ncbi:MAG TPA: Holliday junction branch migration protein RuvA [Cyclobacteriaceae bacterium]|nr:Holliday junction branch migration protein RuvA [Cyclobacteriaceae bacterium]
MIGFIQGQIDSLDLTQVLLDVGGIGYEIRISVNTYSQIKDLEEVRLYTYLQIRDDAHVLYGFFETREKSLFTQLISVSGIGPSTAIMILSSLNVGEIEDAIAAGDVMTLKGIKGIGQKSAERIIVELKDKIRKEKGYDRSAESLAGNQGLARKEALSALITLGIQKSTAEKMIQATIQKYGRNMSVEELIKLSLKSA